MEYDVCIIGSGLAGLAAFEELKKKKAKVCLLEKENNYLSNISSEDIKITNLNNHFKISDVNVEKFGGNSSIWAGRCQLFDEIDFKNPLNKSVNWPIGLKEIDKYYQKASTFLNIGNSSKFKNKKNFKLDPNLNINCNEIWSSSPEVQKKNIFKNKDIKLGYTCVGFIQKNKKNVSYALFKRSNKDKIIKISAKIFIVACGGLASNKLILNSMNEKKGLKLQSKKLVGKYYMGHLSECIANIQFSSKIKEKIFFGLINESGTYTRRLIKFSKNFLIKNKLLNIQFYLKNPDISNPTHNDGLLSLIYLVLKIPIINNLFAPKTIIKKIKNRKNEKILKHIYNLVKNPKSIIYGLCNLFYSKFIKREKYPTRFLFKPIYDFNGLQFLAEQKPNLSCEIFLLKKKDSLDLRKAVVDFNWSKKEINSIIKSHLLLDDILKKKNLGKLVFNVPKKKLFSFIKKNCIDGAHQIGGLRMGTNYKNGVTDKYGKLFGLKNVFISSTALFPTGGASTPTFMLISLVFRQVDFIIKNLKK